MSRDDEEEADDLPPPQSVDFETRTYYLFGFIPIWKIEIHDDFYAHPPKITEGY